MPIEAILSRAMPEPFLCCPRCHSRFRSFLRGQVARFSWWGLRRRIWAVICAECKEIVGHEEIAARARGEGMKEPEVTEADCFGSCYSRKLSAARIAKGHTLCVECQSLWDRAITVGRAQGRREEREACERLAWAYAELTEADGLSNRASAIEEVAERIAARSGKED